MDTRMRRIAAAVLLSVGFGAAPVVMSVASAGASATKCASGAHSYCAYVNGSGLHVNYVTGSFTSTTPICNWTITAEFFDSAGRYYKTFESSRHNGCWLS